MKRRCWSAFALIALLALTACSRGPDETALRERIDAMVQAVEAREPRAFMDGVAADFAGDEGLDRERLQGYLRVQLLRNASIGVTVLSTDLTLHGERATVVQSVLLSGGEGGLLPDRLRRLRIESGWRFGEDGWQVYAARWQPDAE